MGRAGLAGGRYGAGVTSTGSFATVGLVVSVISAVLVVIKFAVGFYFGFQRAVHH